MPGMLANETVIWPCFNGVLQTLFQQLNLRTDSRNYGEVGLDRQRHIRSNRHLVDHFRRQTLDLIAADSRVQLARGDVLDRKDVGCCDCAPIACAFSPGRARRVALAAGSFPSVKSPVAAGGQDVVHPLRLHCA